MLCGRRGAAAASSAGCDRDDNSVTAGHQGMRVIVPISVGNWTRLFSRWDVLAVLLILGLLVFLGEASRHLFEPLTELQRTPTSLDPANLPEYAARTTLRMLVAMALSLLFTFTYVERWRPRTSRPSGCSSRCSTSCNWCRSSPISVTIVVFSAWPWAACSAPNLRRSSRFSPARPGDRGVQLDQLLARCRPSWSRRAPGGPGPSRPVNEGTDTGSSTGLAMGRPTSTAIRS